MGKKVVVLPCSGVGKTYGSIAREAAYRVIKELRPDVTLTVCLPKLIVDDVGARQLVRDNACIVINGCPSKCASFAVESAGGKPAVVFEVTKLLRKYRNLKPDRSSVIELDEKGRKLAEVIAEKVSGEVDRILNSEGV
ncbi:MAG: putative zinc-binding protein [Candidatus Jordarchaeales archaeon]